MSSKIMEHHISRNIPLFIKVKQIIDQEKIYSIEEIVKIIDELIMYEKEIKNIRQRIIDATYNDILSTIIMPLNLYFEHDYELDKKKI